MTQNRGLGNALAFIGRVLVALIFILAGAQKVQGWEGTLHMMEAKGMTSVNIFLAIAIAIELLAGLAIIFGFKARIAAFILFIFLIPTTWIFHDFWKAPEVMREVQTTMFLKNLAIMGGLLLLCAFGPGGWSFDAKNRSK